MLELFNRKSKSYAAIEHVLDKYADQVAANPVLVAARTDFQTRKTAIEAFKVPERTATMPVTGDKINLMDDVFVNAETERNAIILYAQDQKLPELEGKMPRLVSEMYMGTAEERLRRYESIHKEAKAFERELVANGFDADIIAEMDTQLPLLRKKLSATQNAIDDRLVKQQEFGLLFVDMDAFITSRLDRAVRTRFKASPEFVAEYLVAKIMPKSPVRKKKGGTVTPKAAKKEVKQPTNGETTTKEETSTVVFKDVPTPPSAEEATTTPPTQAEAAPSENGVAATGENS